MAPEKDLAVILSTYQRPAHLRRSLASLALQRGVAGRFEVVVTDDGSQDDTADVVAQFARSVDFPVRFTTHPHDGFRLSQCRNEGVRASTGKYLLFSDGDCIFPPDHLAKHLLASLPRVARAGLCYRLKGEPTARLDLTAIEAGMYRRWVTRAERIRMSRKWLSELVYQSINHPLKPKLTGCNIGIWRSDYEAVNGFDESYVGWGCEDDDLAARLRRHGVRIRTVLGYTQAYHMWHPFDPTHPGQWSNGANVGRLCETGRPIRCCKGLVDLISTDSSQSHAA